VRRPIAETPDFRRPIVYIGQTESGGPKYTSVDPDNSAAANNIVFYMLERQRLWKFCFLPCRI
jgi:DNA-binding LacI/PurR family transcriptional regulator